MVQATSQRLNEARTIVFPHDQNVIDILGAIGGGAAAQAPSEPSTPPITRSIVEGLIRAGVDVWALLNDKSLIPAAKMPKKLQDLLSAFRDAGWYIASTDDVQLANTFLPAAPSSIQELTALDFSGGNEIRDVSPRLVNYYAVLRFSAAGDLRRSDFHLFVESSGGYPENGPDGMDLSTLRNEGNDSGWEYYSIQVANIQRQTR